MHIASVRVKYGAMEASPRVVKIIVMPEGQPEYPLEMSDLLTIGRAPANDLVIHDVNASRHHAEIRRIAGGRYQLRDLGSANGTWLNGRPLAAPKTLENGDRILIANVQIQFIAPDVAETEDAGDSMGTVWNLRSETVIVMVSDIRNYTGMSEVLPGLEFSQLISNWFRQSTEMIERRGGAIDKFIGDAVMAYWVLRDRSQPSAEVDAALATAREMIESARAFSTLFSDQFPGHSFRIGIGISMGNAMLGNVGTGETRSFTIVGDTVNLAFRLESLTKEKGYPVVASLNVAESAGGDFRFRNLGRAEVKGRQEPVSICALTLEEESCA